MSAGSREHDQQCRSGRGCEQQGPALATEGEGREGQPQVDEGTNGFDDDQPGQPGYGIVDDAGEMETSPPYPVPLRAIQVKIRVYEPDSRQIREVTVVQDFLPK